MSYNIPRNVKGEGRILYIFSYKALVYTGIGIAIGLVFYLCPILFFYRHKKKHTDILIYMLLPIQY